MAFETRKLLTGLFSLLAVLLIYLLYCWISNTPEINIATNLQEVNNNADANTPQKQGDIGVVGGVGVGSAQVAEFITLNKDNQTERKFGFEKLLHKTGKNWQIEKPYMTIFRPDLSCHLTAETGNVIVDEALGKPSPTDATLTGNVKIHISPENSSDIQDTYIYLDEITFISDKSQLSTAGPVKLVSPNANMSGTGLEVVYNDRANRLEYLRVIQLDTLKLKIPKQHSAALRSPTEPSQTAYESKVEKPTETSSQQNKADSSQKTLNYRCGFDGNVVIKSPEQIISAKQVYINNIFIPKESSEADKDDSTSRNSKRMGNSAENDRKSQDSGEFTDITITCDNGVIITPVDSALTFESFKQNKAKDIEAVQPEKIDPKNFPDKHTLVAEKIDYCALTDKTDVTGPLELTVRINSLNDTETEKKSLPAKIFASEKATFDHTSNSVLFEGNCSCTMRQLSSTYEFSYSLCAPQITAILSSATAPLGPASSVKSVTATGGNVKLATLKMQIQNNHIDTKHIQPVDQDKVLRGMELKCARFDFNAEQNQISAAGPGIMKIKNFSNDNTNSRLSRWGLNKPHWAFLQDFATLVYSLKTHLLTANAEPKQMLRIDYIPITKDRYDQYITIYTTAIKTQLAETSSGQFEIRSLNADDGVFYEQQTLKSESTVPKTLYFSANEMLYEAEDGKIKAWGNDGQPCLLNGALVDGIECNLKTGKAKNKIFAPGSLR
ncbi:MAG: LPS export ABC transporter periplasmic protein LptC [Sedimentisphaerales bacterium]|nr:LPS export ABC transporter periplasmic protein LptC [Sedimentisphaerales bacterium]